MIPFHKEDSTFNKSYRPENVLPTVNNNKHHLLVSRKKPEHMWLKIGNETICESNSFHLLGMTIVSCLTLEEHLSKLLCKKANGKIKVLSNLGKYLSFEKRGLIFKVATHRVAV